MERRLAVGITALACVVLVAGWEMFRFTLDDAYIAWRYASNLMDGHGLVWNPEPFRPVEGYTSLLWVLVVSGIWALTGIQPPESANPILLLCSVGSVLLTARLAWGLPLSERLAPHRLAVLGLVLAGTVSNRTFLIWSSSGLEAAMLTVEILGWVAVACLARPGLGRVLALGLIAACIELTRPDGLLFVACAAAIAGWELWRTRRPQAWLGFLPLALPALHLAWRFATYGAWLPNTYYAKHASPWPLSGTIYLSSFLLEYALYLPFLIGIGVGVRALRARTRPELEVGAGLALAAVFGQFAYYTFDIGGDHFGYRIYHHLVPLGWLLAAWVVDRTGWSARRALATLTLTLALGWVIPWTHHVRTEDLAAVRARDGDPHRISPDFPPILDLWPWAWEQHQLWLRNHFVCIRRRAHVNYIESQKRQFPSREQGLALDPGPDIPVIALNGVGYPAWAMPRVAILDQLGLNDAVIARNPVKRETRKMAHDRVPPKGYVACFRPNVTAKDGVVRITPRRDPLDADDVRRCERMTPSSEESP